MECACPIHFNASSIRWDKEQSQDLPFMLGFAASSIAEEQSIDPPVEQQNGQAPVENQYDLPNILAGLYKYRGHQD